MSTETKIKSVYSDIVIEYDEERNVWLFELRGRDRSAESLVKAKEAIDKAPAPNKKAFARTPAFRFTYNDVTKGAVTSIAGDSTYGGVSVWFVSNKGERSKESASKVYILDFENEGHIAQWRQLRAEKLAIEQRLDLTVACMKNFKAIAETIE